jgi:nucleoside-diphosphate-sugar epimerase
MKVLALGGTGAMGMHLVQLLAKNGIETVVTSRKYRSSERNVRYIQGNAHDIEFLKSVLNQHWDAIVDFMVYTTPSFSERIDLLLDATSQYVYLSSARVYANSEKPITEDSSRLLEVSNDKEFLATEEYALAKARQEDILQKARKKNWTIIRPYITYSESRLQLGVLEKEGWLYRALHGRTIIFSNRIISKISTFTYGYDVAKGIESIIGHSNSKGKAFHITGNDSCTWDRILTVYLDVLENYLGYRPKVLLTNFDNYFNIHPAKYQIIYDRFYNREFDNYKISKFVDTNEFKPIEDGLKNCLVEFLRNPRFKAINWKREALKDKQTKEHTPLIEIPGTKNKLRYLKNRYIG